MEREKQTNSDRDRITDRQGQRERDSDSEGASDSVGDRESRVGSTYCTHTVPLVRRTGKGAPGRQGNRTLQNNNPHSPVKHTHTAPSKTHTHRALSHTHTHTEL